MGEPDSFVGHIGGDDFVTLLEAEHAEEFCKHVVEHFDDGILDFYDTADALRGYIEVIDRRGERYAFPVVSISLGVVTNLHRVIDSQWEASAVAVEMKEFAKKKSGLPTASIVDPHRWARPITWGEPSNRLAISDPPQSTSRCRRRRSNRQRCWRGSP